MSDAYVQKALAEQAARHKILEEQLMAQWNAPINFYGKVIDENGVAVEAANVDFSWGSWEAPLVLRESQSQTTTDTQGRFLLQNEKGKRLTVGVGKAGYYSTGTARQAFEYGDPLIGIFMPDAANPVLFQLRKRGLGTDLVTSRYGVKDFYGVTMPIDGTPVQVRLLERRVGEGGELRMTQTKPSLNDVNVAELWTFRMEIPNGGFVEHNDQFPFEAPANGYQPTIEFSFQKGQTNWMKDLNKDYYIRFGDPPRYGRLHLETSIRMSGARLTYAINPDGSRYLEPK